MTRRRDPIDVRDDALWMGARKAAEGCTECAEAYFALARQNGATAEQVERARSSGADYTRVTRRAVLKSAAATATGLAASVAAGSLLPAVAHAAMASATAASTPTPPPAWRAWIVGSTSAAPAADTLYMTSPAGAHSLAGLGSDASIASLIEGVSAQIFRSPDGREFYLPWAEWQTTMTTTKIEAYSATTGARERTLVGRSIERGPADDIWDGLWPALNADGSLVAVLRRTHATYGRFGPGKASGTVPGRQELILGLEVFNMQTGRSSYVELDREDDRLVANSIALLSPNGSRAFVFVRRYGSARLRDSLTVVDVSAADLTVVTRLSDGEGGHIIPFLGRPDDMNSVRITPDGRQLVLFSLPEVVWFDLHDLTVAKTLTLPISPEANGHMPARPYGRFAPDASMLYIAGPESGDLFAVDLRERTLAQPGELPNVTSTESQGLDSYSLGSQSVAIAADGSQLYVADGRGGSGFWVLELPSLKVQAHLLTGHDVHALWAAPDGTIYALSEGLSYALSRGGSLRGAADAGNAYAFALPATTQAAMW